MRCSAGTRSMRAICRGGLRGYRRGQSWSAGDHAAADPGELGACPPTRHGWRAGSHARRAGGARRRRAGEASTPVGRLGISPGGRCGCTRTATIVTQKYGGRTALDQGRTCLRCRGSGPTRQPRWLSSRSDASTRYSTTNVRRVLGAAGVRGASSPRRSPRWLSNRLAEAFAAARRGRRGGPLVRRCRMELGALTSYPPRPLAGDDCPLAPASAPMAGPQWQPSSGCAPRRPDVARVPTGNAADAS